MTILSVIGKILLILLKIIGWTLVGIVGLVLLILLIALFLPIGYNAKAEAGTENVEADVHVHLLLHLIHARIQFREKKLQGNLRIFWFRKNLMGEKVSKEEETEPVSDEEKQKLQEWMEEPEPPLDATPEKTPEAASQTDVEPEPAEEPTPEETNEPEPEATQEPATEETLPLSDKIDRILDAIYGRYSRISGKVRSFTTKIQQRIYKVEKLWYEIVYYPDRYYLQTLLIRQVKKILRRVRPRKLQMDLVCGTGNPALTGEITGAYGLATAWVGRIRKYRVDFQPDFETKHLEGSLYIKGRLQGYMVLFPAVRLILDKRVRRLIRRVRKKS